MRCNDSTKSSSGGSRRKPFCHPPTPPRCCSGRYLHQGRSTCARSMVGKRLPQSPLISQLTLPPETIPSCDRRMRHTNSNHFPDGTRVDDSVRKYPGILDLGELFSEHISEHE